MSDRIRLQEELEKILGSRNVYYQPPESIKIDYPAIIYSLNNIDNVFADDNPYLQNYSYQITVIDKNPDSEIPIKVSKLPLCRFSRNFKSDNLNHNVFILNYNGGIQLWQN